MIVHDVVESTYVHSDVGRIVVVRACARARRLFSFI